MPYSENLTILFVDMVGFTERTSAQSRAQNQTMLSDYNRLLRKVIASFGGRPVKSIGDALLVTFRSPTDGVRCGMAMHDALAEYNIQCSVAERMQIRVALNVGEVRLEHRDIFGEAVNVASRVESLTPPGNVYLTEAVYLAMNKAEVLAELVGKQKLKGIPEAVRVFRVPPRQINRLIAVGGELGNDPEELPFGGMHRLPRRIGSLEILQPVWVRLQSTYKKARALPRWHTLAGVSVMAAVLLTAVIGFRHDPIPASDGAANDAMTLGHVATIEGKFHEATINYERALKLKPDLKDDPILAANLVAALSWASEQAIPLIRENSSPQIIEALARRTGQPGRRGAQRAAQLLTDLGHAARIDHGAQAIVALQESVECNTRLKAVRQIRQLRDARALPALRAETKGPLNWFRNDCLRQEALLAMKEIETARR